MARLGFLWPPYGPLRPRGPLGAPWGVPGGSLEGPKRVQIWVFGHFEAIRGWVRPGLGQINGGMTSYGPAMTSYGPWGPWGAPGGSLEGP